MRIFKFTGAVATLLLLAACVTINIYFPAAQAEEAAKEIVEDILDKANDSVTPSTDKGASLETQGSRSLGALILDAIIPTAQAAEPDFNVNTAGIRKIRASMKKRNKSLSAFYESGAVGFTKNALVAIRDQKAVPLKQRNTVNKLVSAENHDRENLYQSIADANGHPEWEPDVRAVFAKTWIREARKGWWYQNSKGKWQQK